METSLATYWFVIVTFMLAVYVVLDGFDFGTGIIYLFAARSDVERRTVLRAIGPVWNGNEVWLLAGGGLLFFAFPKVYAAGFSGFYLALVIVLWLLMFRGLSIELRSHVDHPLWRALWDAGFAVASLLLAIVFGAALGNLLRGVPLTPEGYFFTALWTTFTPGPEPGILDWYTILMGVLGAVVLAGHGANYLAMKTSGDLSQRVCRVARVTGWLMAGLSVVAILATAFVQPALRRNYDAHPVGYALPVLGAVALAGMLYFHWRARYVAAFLASSAFIVGMLGGAAWGLFPNLLLATQDPAWSLTVHNAAAPGGLGIGLVWFAVGISLVVIYTVYVYRSFWGKVDLSSLDGGK